MDPRRWRKRSCKRCGKALDPFDRCRRRTCPGYRSLWSQDWRVSLLRNLEELQHVALVTVTGPGAEAGLPWDRSRCTHEAGERCSGPKGCRVHKGAADQWNNTAAQRRSRLHDAAQARVRRRFGSVPRIAARASEVQARGITHYHLVFDYTPGIERAKVDEYVRWLKELAPRYMFGFCDLGQSFAGAGGLRCACYCAKYVGKATLETAQHERRPVMVGKHLTEKTGVTMRALRWRRFLHFRLDRDITLAELPSLIAQHVQAAELDQASRVVVPRGP